MSIKQETLMKILQLVGKMDEKQLRVFGDALKTRHRVLRQEHANTMIFQLGEGDRVKLSATMKRKYLRGATGKVTAIRTGRFPLEVTFDRLMGPNSVSAINVGYEAVEKL